jgi:hypothetical protein
LDAKSFFVLDKQLLKICFRLSIKRMIGGVAQAPKRDHRIEHGGKDCCQTVVAVANSLNHPTLSFL